MERDMIEVSNFTNKFLYSVLRWQIIVLETLFISRAVIQCFTVNSCRQTQQLSLLLVLSNHGVLILRISGSDRTGR